MSSSTFPSSSSLLKEPLLNSSKGSVPFSRKVTLTPFTITLIYAVFLAAHALLIAHLFRSPPPSTVFQAPPPPSEPLWHSIVKEDCSSYPDGPTACFEALASLPTIHCSESTKQVVAYTIDEIHEQTVVLHSKLVDILEKAKENRNDHNKFQHKRLEQCVKLTENILGFRLETEVHLRGGGTILEYFEMVGNNKKTCLVKFEDESDWLEKGLSLEVENSVWERVFCFLEWFGSSYKPLKGVVNSVWVKVVRLQNWFWSYKPLKEAINSVWVRVGRLLEWFGSYKPSVWVRVGCLQNWFGSYIPLKEAVNSVWARVGRLLEWFGSYKPLKEAVNSVWVSLDHLLERVGINKNTTCLGQCKPLKEVVDSVWYRVDSLQRIGLHVANVKGIQQRPLEDLDRWSRLIISTYYKPTY